MMRKNYFHIATRSNNSPFLTRYGALWKNIFCNVLYVLFQ